MDIYGDQFSVLKCYITIFASTYQDFLLSKKVII